MFLLLCAAMSTELLAQMEVHHAKPIEIYKGDRSATQSRSSGSAQNTAADLSFFFRTFGLAIPGVAYVVDNVAAGTRTSVVSAGGLQESSIQIRPDQTYKWNSKWDGRIINGKWENTKDGLLIRKGQEGKDWLLEKLPRPAGKAIVALWDRNATWYNGTPLP